MSPESATYPGYRFPAEIIRHAVWLYHVFSLSLRDVELILAERGKRWSPDFGQVGKLGLPARRTDPDDGQADAVFG